MASSSSEKRVMVLAMDEHEHSKYALEWTLDRFFIPFGSNAPFTLVLVYARPLPPAAVAMGGGLGPAAIGPEILPAVEIQQKLIADQITEKAKKICADKSYHDEVVVEVAEGDPRNVLCDAVDRLNAAVLVLGSHGYGAIKRAFLGSVSDHCTHHANCSVMIVKKPKSKN